MLTSEHPGTAGAWRSGGPAAVCQRVAADDQLQDITRLSQKRHRQAAVEVPCTDVVDLQDPVKGPEAPAVGWPIRAHSVDIDAFFQEAI